MRILINKQFIEYADKLYLTEIDAEDKKADTFFPEVNLNDLPGPQVVNNLEYTLPEEETANHVEIVETGPQFMTDEVVAPTINPNDRPDFVRDTEDKVFLTPESNQSNAPVSNEIKVDAPVGTALSDINTPNA